MRTDEGSEPPQAEPALTPSWIGRLLDTLDGIGTPEAEAARAALGEAAEILSGALEMATAVLHAATPTEH